MEVGSPEWIEASLAKLDDLERQHGEHETALESALDPLTLKQHNDALERLDAEIKALYAQLEDIAEDDDEDEPAATASGVVGPRVTQGDDERSSPYVAATMYPPRQEAPQEAPRAEPAEVVAVPMSAPAETPFEVATPSAVAMPSAAFDDDDLKVKGGAGKWIFVGLIVAAAVGVGGFFAWQDYQAKNQVKPKVETPTIVIEAVAVPEDTEAPNAAKGGDATISPTASGTAGPDTGKKKPEPKKTKPLKLKVGDDPL